MTHQGTQRLETDRLVLRRFTEDDAAPMYRNWAADEDVTKYLTWPPHANLEVSRSIIKEWLHAYESERYYHWAIVLKCIDEPIGGISVVRMDEESSVAEIGYCIGKNWWHQGITSEALKAVIGFLFDQADVHHIQCRHDPRNPNSGKVMKKCGMKYKETLINADKNNQGICDVCCYEIDRPSIGIN